MSKEFDPITIQQQQHEVAQHEQSRWHIARNVALAAIAAVGVSKYTPAVSTEAYGQSATPEATAEPSNVEENNPSAIYGWLKSAQDQASSENPGWKMIYPKTEEDVAREVGTATRTSGSDNIRSVSFKKTGRNYKVTISKNGARSTVSAAKMQDPEDLNYDYLKYYDISVASRYFTDKYVKVTPMIRPEAGKGKPKRWGRTKYIKNWDEVNSPLYKVIKNGESIQDPLRNYSVNVRPKSLTSALIRSGRFYIDVSYGCKVKGTSFSSTGEPCTTEYGASYRVNKNKMSYRQGNSYSTSSQLEHVRKIPKSRAFTS